MPYGAERGGHAHRKLVQLIVPLSGRFVLRTHDGATWSEDEVADPAVGLIVPTMTWRELVRFSSGAVCMVLASEHYDESDYIRSFDAFLGEARP
jgi:dTDP-4-dehydrorhamnose 3,5-epimerase-like enzyme